MSQTNSPLLARWAEAEQWYSQRSRREQVLIGLSAIVVLMLVLHHFWLQPAQAQRHADSRQLTQQATDVTSLRQDVERLERELQTDPNDALRQRQAELQTRQQRLQARLDERAQLMPAQASVAWIDALLDLPSGIELLSFDTHTPIPMITLNEPAGAANSGSANVWRHTVEVQVIGRYHDLRDYVEGLEQLSQPFYWNGLRYEVQEYPQAQLTIRVYALSTAQELLGG